MDSMWWGQFKDVFGPVVAIGWLAWGTYLAFTIYRRKQKNDMQRHVLEKFSSAQDFAEFIQSPAGQKYVTSFTDTVTNPMGSIINSIKIGFVVMFAGVGFLAGSVGSNAFTTRIGFVLSLTGIGFLCAALVSYFLARKIGWREKE